MRNPDRIEDIIERLRLVWHAKSDMRLGQLILNCFSLHNGVDAAVYHMEDEDFIDYIERSYGMR